MPKQIELLKQIIILDCGGCYMSGMVDPYNAYLSFRQAAKQNILHFQTCELHPDVKLHFDEPEKGKRRLTYATFDNNIAKGILQITPSGWVEDILYFQLGIAVGEEFRGQGLGEELHRKGLEEFLAHFPRPKSGKLGIEAIISESNIISQKLAAKTFPNPPTQVIDEYSGEPALLYEIIVID